MIIFVIYCQQLNNKPVFPKDTSINGEFVSQTTTALTATSVVFPISCVRI